MYKRLFLVANLLMLSAILFWAWNNISLTKVIEQFKIMPPEGLFVALALNIAVLSVYGSRLALLLSTNRLQALMVAIIGFGMNNVLPLRLGEVAKLAYARQLFGISTSRLITATAAEKFMDLCALLLLGIIASQLVVASYLTRGVAVAAFLVGGLVLAFIAAFMALAHWKHTGRKVHSSISDAFDTLRTMGSNKPRMIWLALLTAIIWAITVASVYWLFHSIYPRFSLSDASALTLVLALAIAIPSAPAGLGVVEAAIVAYLHQTMQAEPNLALASALAFHFIVVIPQMLITIMILLVASLRRHWIK